MNGSIQIPSSNQKRSHPAVSHELVRVDRTSRVQQVCDQIRSGILGGTIGKEDQLPSEGELATELGVSRTVVREAMRSLQAQGLLEKSQGKRARLKSAGSQAVAQSLEIMLLRTRGSLLHLMEVRRALEVEIAMLATERATPDQIQGLYAAVETQRSVPTLEESVQADVLFHRLLAEATGNRLFELLLESVSGVLHETVWRTLPKSGPQPAIDGHLKIADAVAHRDREAARAAMLEHMNCAEGELEEGSDATGG